MKLNEIKDNVGSSGVARRVGRGIGSGWGKTSARGQKGQYARNTVRPGFEGGQTPLYRRMPKRGFTNIHAKTYLAINLGSIQKHIDSGKLDVSKTFDIVYLREVGVVKGVMDGIRLLAKGELKSKVSFLVSGASEAAKSMVAKVGGKVDIIPVVDKTTPRKKPIA